MTTPTSQLPFIGKALRALRVASGPEGLANVQHMGLARTSMFQFEAGRGSRTAVRRLFEWAWYWESSIEDLLRRPPPTRSRSRTRRGWPDYYVRRLHAVHNGGPLVPLDESHERHCRAIERAVLLAIIGARQSADFSQVELASRIGYDQATVSRIEAGVHGLHLQYVELAATACGSSLSAILLSPPVLAAEERYLKEFHRVHRAAASAA